MNPDDSADAQLADAAFAAAMREEPALHLDLAAIERRGAARLHRRRTVAVSGLAVAVAAVTVGVTIGVPRLTGNQRPATTPTVPGCTTVLRSTDPVYLSWKYDGDIPTTPPLQSGETLVQMTSAAQSAGVPDPSAEQAPAWFTVDKAASMSMALRSGLPAGVTLSPDVHDKRSDPLPFTNDPSGAALLTRGGSTARLVIQSQRWDKTPPPCTDQIVMRYTSPDGTVVDVYAGTGPYSYLGADAFHPDGTWVNAYLQPPDPLDQHTSLPLTAQQLAELAASPGLSISG